MKNTLLVQSLSGNWCIYHRNANQIPHTIFYGAMCIYNIENGTWIKKLQGIPLPKNISSLPVAEHILSPLGKFVAGIIFDDDYIGHRHSYNVAKCKMEMEYQYLKTKLSF